MPEQISKYPEVTLEVLKGAGARCGEGAEQRILTRCPPERFCSLHTGEICVYGIDDISQMTQITTQELARSIRLTDESFGTAGRSLTSFEGAVLGVLFIAGLLLGRLWARLEKS